MRGFARPSPRSRSAFSLAELLVVMGVIALLTALLLPPLQLARRQAATTHCAASLAHIGMGLEQCIQEFKFYPHWDDGRTPFRRTWIDVLIERDYIHPRAGYCAQDRRPDFLNEARGQAYGVLYPRNPSRYGIGFSYGISVILASGGWAWRPDMSDPRPRRLEDHERYTSQRVLAADGNWSAIYNLSGEALRTNIWNLPTQYDNTVGYRHPDYSSNLLFQDGHVSRLVYRLNNPQPVDTTSQFMWYPTEPMFVNPSHHWNTNFYPNAIPQGVFPDELAPAHYTDNDLWTHGAALGFN